MTKKPITNVQLVKKMMEFSEAGAIKQAFIIEAIRYYSELQVAQPEWTTRSFISQESWKLCAKECLSALENRSTT